MAEQYAEVIERATRVIARTDLTPAARAWPLRNRAVAKSALGQFDAAVADGQEAMRMDPTCYYIPLVLARGICVSVC